MRILLPSRENTPYNSSSLLWDNWMYKSFRNTVLATCVLLTGTLFSQAALVEDIKIGEKFTLASKVLDEEREYWVSLPLTYNNKDTIRYPVLYMFDPDLNAMFHVFSGMVKQMGADATPVIPEMIVVGIVNKNRVKDSSPTHSLIQYGGGENQAQDVSGGADSYLKFIKDELIPRIEKGYKTENYRILTGYSFTGPTVIHALYTLPELFNAYISIDPSLWWDDKILIRRYEAFQKSAKLSKRRLFVAGTERVESVFPDENTVLEFIKLVNEKPTDNLAFGSEIFSTDENHHTMQIQSLYRGLRFIFDGHMIRQDQQFHPAIEVKNQFNKLSEKLGHEFKLREGLINWFGYGRLYNKQFGIDVERAIEFFRLNTEYYPESSNTWDSLGEAYSVSGDKKQSLFAYRRALTLNPDNQNAQNKIELLEQ